MLSEPCRLYLIFAALFLPLVATGGTSRDNRLTSLSESARSRSPELRALHERWEEAKARTLEAWSNFLPRIDLNLTQSRSQDFSILQSGALGANAGTLFRPQALSLSRWEILGTLPLFQRSYQLEVIQRKSEAELARVRFEKASAELEVQVHEAYGAWLADQADLLALATALRASTVDLKETELRFQLGSATLLDSLKARTHQGSLEARRPRLEQAVAQSREALEILCGAIPEVSTPEVADRLAEISDPRPWTASLPLGDFDALLPELLSHDLEWNTIEKENVTAESLLRVPLATEFPTFQLQARVNRLGPDWPTALVTQDLSYSLAAVVSIPITSGGRLIQRLRQKRHGGSALQAENGSRTSRWRREARASWQELQVLQAELKSLRLQTEQQAELERLTRKSHSLGKAPLTDLLNAQDVHLQAQTQVTRTALKLTTLARRWQLRLGVDRKVQESTP
jgi:outer membrane protein TolC